MTGKKTPDPRGTEGRRGDLGEVTDLDEIEGKFVSSEKALQGRVVELVRENMKLAFWPVGATKLIRDDMPAYETEDAVRDRGIAMARAGVPVDEIMQDMERRCTDIKIAYARTRRAQRKADWMLLAGFLLASLVLYRLVMDPIVGPPGLFGVFNHIVLLLALFAGIRIVFSKALASAYAGISIVVDLCRIGVELGAYAAGLGGLGTFTTRTPFFWWEALAFIAALAVMLTVHGRYFLSLIATDDSKDQAIKG